MKKLGFGLMRLPLTNPDVASSIDIEELSKMVDMFLDRGFTYFDTAWLYHAFSSEGAIKKALVDRYPRDKFTLATKLHHGFIHTMDDRDNVFNTQLERTGAGFFDYYLIHDINIHSIETYEKLDCFNWLIAKKEAGLAKTIGFSFHDGPELLDKVLTNHPEMEFVQLQLNYLDWNSTGIQSKNCYDVAVKHGKKVIVMEPVKGGTLAKVPADVEKTFKDYAPDLSIASWAIRFAASLEHVMVVLSGMSNLAQIDDNTSYMSDFKPLNSDEQDLVFKAVDMINSNIAIPCTGCAYCTEGCPQHIAIPSYFSLYNADLQESDEKPWTPQGEYYRNLIKDFGKASDCIECGQCEEVCPQHLHIIDNLKLVAKHFE